MEAATISFGFKLGEMVVGKLVTLLEEEVQLISGMESDLKFMKDEIKSASAMLKKMSSQSSIKECDKVWTNQVRDLIYEAEDIIDEYLYHIARGGGASQQYTSTNNTFSNKFRTLRNKFHILSSYPKKKWYHLKVYHRIASHLKELKLKTKEVKERRDRYELKEESQTQVPPRIDPRLRALFVKKDNLVGIAEQQDTIMRLLTDDISQNRVISVVGPGGLGKTTLAVQCYESPEVPAGHFSYRAQVVVSRTFDFDKLLKSLFKQFSGVISEDMDTKGLLTGINNKLKGKRYVVLLDDIWTVDAWKDFSCAFPDDGNGSRIIITTRVKQIANYCSRKSGYVHEIQPLTDEQSSELFHKLVFFNPPLSCPRNLQDLMEGILKKCGGMPLAIVTVAGILVSNYPPSRKHWKRVHDHIGNTIEQILMLSYNHLSDDVKPCFLYLSIFPEDWKFKRSDLVKRWITEGLVIGSSRENAEEIAQGYFDELVNSNLINPAYVKRGEVKLWKMHDLILEIIVEKATYENFVYIAPTMDFEDGPPADSKIRRVSVHAAVDNLCNGGTDLSLVRSLSLNFVSNNNNKTIIPPSLDHFKKMRLLRMLNMEGCSFIDNTHVEHICDNFLLLRYLCLGSAEITTIPDSIRKLQRLEVLDISNTNVFGSYWTPRSNAIIGLPQSIMELQRLSHLYISIGNPGLRAKTLQGTMRSLRVLKFKRVVDFVIVMEPDSLIQLEKLQITFINRTSKGLSIFVSEFPAYLDKISNSLLSLTIQTESNSQVCNVDHLVLDPIVSPPLKLETLKLNGIRLENGMPTWFSSLDHLTKMSLVFLDLKEEDIRRLGELPSLRILHLKIDEAMTDASIGPEGFRLLYNLSLIFGNIKVRFQQGALPNLEFLDLFYRRGGRNTGETFFGIENLANLKEINYRGADDNKVDELRRAKEAHANNPKLTTPTS